MLPRLRRSQGASLIPALGLALGLAAAPSPAAADPALMRQIQGLSLRIEADPDRPELLLQRAELYLQAGRWDEALLDLDQVEALGADDPALHLLRAQVAWDRGQADLARGDLTLYLQLRPQSFAGWWLMARVARQQRDPQAALDAYALATSLHASVDVTLEHGDLVEELEQWEVAEDVYRQGLETLGDATLVRRALIDLLLRRGRHGEAVLEIDRAMAPAQVKTEWLLLRAQARAGQGDAAGAAADRRLALREADALVAQRPSALALLQRARANLALAQLGAAELDARHVRARAPALPGLSELFADLRKAQLESAEVPQ